MALTGPAGPLSTRAHVRRRPSAWSHHQPPAAERRDRPGRHAAHPGDGRRGQAHHAMAITLLDPGQRQEAAHPRGRRSPPARSTGTRTGCRQVLENLIGTPSSTTRTPLQSGWTLRKTEKAVLLEVRGRRPGLTEADRPRSSAVSSGSPRGPPGARPRPAWGLSIVKQLVELGKWGARLGGKRRPRQRHPLLRRASAVALTGSLAQE